jgi:CheY-like chemotaxis protein
MHKEFKVLVVDDNISTVNALLKLLQENGYLADPAYNGTDAMHKISANDYDIVLSDIEMPNMNGLELLKRVRQDFDDIAFILMTDDMQQDYFIEAIQLGASDLIRKPVDRMHLLKSLRIQINKKKEIWDYLQVSECISQAEIKLTLPPLMFQKVDFIKIFTKFFRTNLNLNNKVVNELLLCMEEMLYNAFIHGTLNLKLHERTLSYEDYKKLIQYKIQQPDIAKKRIHLCLFVDQENDKIVFEVEDEGDGFDHKLWTEKSNSYDGIQLDEYGRGISIIYYLTDKVTFDKDGRLIRIEKKLSDASRKIPVSV